MNDKRRRHHTAQGHHGANAEINAAADNDHGHAERPDRDDDRLHEDDFEIGSGQKIGPDFGAQREQTDHQDEAEKRSCRVQQTCEPPGRGRGRYVRDVAPDGRFCQIQLLVHVFS